MPFLRRPCHVLARTMRGGAGGIRPVLSHEDTLVVLQVLAFTQHPHMLLAAKAMPFWTGLLSERPPGSRPEAALTPQTSPIPLDCATVLLDLAGGPPCGL